MSCEVRSDKKLWRYTAPHEEGRTSLKVKLTFAIKPQRNRRNNNFLFQPDIVAKLKTVKNLVKNKIKTSFTQCALLIEYRKEYSIIIYTHTYLFIYIYNIFIYDKCHTDFSINIFKGSNSGTKLEPDFGSIH